MANIRKYKSSDYQEILDLLKLNTPKYFAEEEEKDLIYYLESHSDNFFV